MKHYTMGIREYSVVISSKNFESVKLAKEHLLNALFIEEKLNLVLENYAELEKELLKLTVDSILFPNNKWSASADERNIINRRIINLLSTCRLYTDQVRQNIRLIYGKGSDQYTKFKKALSQEYDSNFSYRLMEALRNYVQHRDLPVHILRKHNSIVKREPLFVRKNVIQVYAKVDYLRADSNFKKSILSEIEGFEDSESLELIIRIREYLSSLGKIHEKVRKLIKPDITLWEEIIKNIIDMNDKESDTPGGLKAIKIDSQTNKIIHQFDIFYDFIQRRTELEEKNKYLTHYSFNYVSGESPLINSSQT